jgi:hypothetical protein
MAAGGAIPMCPPKRNGVPLIRPSNLDALKEMRLGDGTPPRNAFIYSGNWHVNKIISFIYHTMHKCS